MGVNAEERKALPRHRYSLRAMSKLTSSKKSRKLTEEHFQWLLHASRAEKEITLLKKEAKGLNHLGSVQGGR